MNTSWYKMTLVAIKTAGIQNWISNLRNIKNKERLTLLQGKRALLQPLGLTRWSKAYSMADTFAWWRVQFELKLSETQLKDRTIVCTRSALFELVFPFQPFDQTRLCCPQLQDYELRWNVLLFIGKCPTLLPIIKSLRPNWSNSKFWLAHFSLSGATTWTSK